MDKKYSAFYEEFYLRMNPDVAQAMRDGHFTVGYDHFVHWGMREGRAASALIYDVGMNNGDDCEYYLRKGFKVVAIEANPALCAQAQRRFSSEVADGLLSILNVGVGSGEGTLDFYVHKEVDQWSTFLTQDMSSGNWDILPVKVRKLSSIVEEHGDPFYIKIDVENYDDVVLAEMRESGLLPPYVSAEAHKVEVLCHLILMGYTQFKITRGATVHLKYVDHHITTAGGCSAIYSFPLGSSGPFGEDLPGKWLDVRQTMAVVAELEDTWFDIHARRGDLRV